MPTKTASSKALTSLVASLGVASLAVAAFAGASLGGERTAAADEVSPHGKGIVGGGLLGAEVVTSTEAIIGVHNPWAYLIGGVAGAGGGAVGGYFVEQASGDGRGPMYMLAGGLALIIPAVVLTLDATRFRPSEDATEDKAPTNSPPADPGKVGGSAVVGPNGASTAPGPAPSAPAGTPPAAGGSGAPAPSTPTPPAPSAPGPSSMLHFEGGQLRLGVPVPEVRPMYTALEQRTLGLPGNVTEMRMPLLRVAF